MGFVCMIPDSGSVREEKLFLSLSCSMNHLREDWNCLWRNLSYLLLKMEQINLRKKYLAWLASTAVCRRRWQSRAIASRLLPAACQVWSPFVEISSLAWKKELLQLLRKQGKQKGKPHRAPARTNCLWLGWICLGKEAGKRKVTA